jgi:hypothetical protein
MAVTIFPKAAPMTTPTARSTTLPLNANFLKSSMNAMGFSRERLLFHDVRVRVDETHRRRRVELGFSGQRNVVVASVEPAPNALR